MQRERLNDESIFHLRREPVIAVVHLREDDVYERRLCNESRSPNENPIAVKTVGQNYH